MRILLFLSTIAAIATPMRAEADPCARGYESVAMAGPWTTVCAPVTDPQYCGPIDPSTCYRGMDIGTISHLLGCMRDVRVLNERCEVNKAVWRYQRAIQTECDGVGQLTAVKAGQCETTRAALQRARDRARHVHEKTERELKQPSSSGGGFSLCV